MKNHKLEYHSPANEWIEGMPFGNGKMGFVLFGDPGKETFSMNHERLWRKNIKRNYILLI